MTDRDDSRASDSSPKYGETPKLLQEIHAAASHPELSDRLASISALIGKCMKAERGRLVEYLRMVADHEDTPVEIGKWFRDAADVVDRLYM